MFENILVPLDGSEQALPIARDLAQHWDPPFT